MRRVLIMLVAAVAFASVPAFALPESRPAPAAPAGASDAATEAGARAYVDWIRRVTTITAHASQASNLLGSLSNSFTSREDVLRNAPQIEATIAQARGMLSDASAELDAMPVLSREGLTAAMSGLADAQLRDARTYIANMNELLDANLAMIAALQQNNAAALQRALAQLGRSAVVLVEGQRTILRGRQQLVTDDHSDHHIIGAMIAMYDGMMALMTEDDALRRTQLLAAASQADQWSVSGRAALAGERLSIARYEPVSRVAMSEYLQVNETAFALNDRIAAFLRNSADASVGQDQRTRQWQEIAQLESECQALAQRQVSVMSRMVQH